MNSDWFEPEEIILFIQACLSLGRAFLCKARISQKSKWQTCLLLGLRDLLRNYLLLDYLPDLFILQIMIAIIN